ncbi:hypothetical protein C362_06673 [Cryptococcus neoformans Bt1]|nr:hypothetical protein C362_06673 [Cryptococcus neoformans var. grubii Bt1]
MVGPRHSTLDEDEDNNHERLRKRIRQEKEEEEEGDDNDIVQWNICPCNETADIADVILMPLFIGRASTSPSVTPSLHIPCSSSESGAFPSGAPSSLVTPGSQGTTESNSVPNIGWSVTSTKDQLQLLTEASKANSERRHKDILHMQEVKHTILKEGIAAKEKRAVAEVKKVNFDMWKEFLMLHRAEGVLRLVPNKVWPWR